MIIEYMEQMSKEFRKANPGYHYVIITFQNGEPVIMNSSLESDDLKRLFEHLIKDNNV